MVRAARYILLLTFALTLAGCGASAPSDLAADPPTPAVVPATPTVIPTASGSLAQPAADDLVRLVLVPEQSEARYRVREQLAGVSLPSDAVGATQSVTGTIVGKRDGTIVASESKFRVDLRTLKSNEDRRDNFLRRNVLETDKFPYAEFVPTEAPGLPLSLPASGDVEFKLVGNLTIRNVTKPVTWDVKGKVEGDEATGTAKTSFTFEYFDLTQPRVPLVLSIEDHIGLEMDVHLKRQ